MSSEGKGSPEVAELTATGQDFGRQLTRFIKAQPVTSLSVAAAVGFVFGGGLNSRIGLALVTIGSRAALRGFVVTALTGAFTGARHDSTSDRRKEGNGNYYGAKDRVDLEVP